MSTIVLLVMDQYQMINTIIRQMTNSKKIDMSMWDLGFQEKMMMY